jgi:tRNA-dihydrouridine synthase C
MLPKNSDGCPYLILAPMEGVGDQCFRKAITSIGGFDEAVRDFLRVPINAHIPSLASRYQAQEIQPIPLAAQLMGSDPVLMADMAYAMQLRGAPRIDLNCGCPSNTVTGKGAGSSLLKDPNYLYQIAKAMVQAVSIPVTAKLRSGFNDISLFRENLLAAQESGIRYLTLHPRTKEDGYGPPAKWELIAEAKALLRIPVVGNGDILTVNDALNMLKLTQCDALMIGRGSLINPFIFHQIKAYFAGKVYASNEDALVRYFEVYLANIEPTMPEKAQVNKLKQMISFLFKSNSVLLDKRQDILRSSYPNARAVVDDALFYLKQGWSFRV